MINGGAVSPVDPNSGAVIANGYRSATSDSNFIDLQLAMEQLGAMVIDVDATKSSISSMEGRQALNYMYELGLVGMPNGRGGSIPQRFLTVWAPFNIRSLPTRWRIFSEIQASGRIFRVARYVGPEAKDLVHHNVGTLFMVLNTKYPDAAYVMAIERDNLKNYLAHGSLLSVMHAGY